MKLDPLPRKLSKHFSLHPSRQKTLTIRAKFGEGDQALVI